MSMFTKTFIRSQDGRATFEFDALQSAMNIHARAVKPRSGPWVLRLKRNEYAEHLASLSTVERLKFIRKNMRANMYHHGHPLTLEQAYHTYAVFERYLPFYEQFRKFFGIRPDANYEDVQMQILQLAGYFLEQQAAQGEDPSVLALLEADLEEMMDAADTPELLN